MWDKEYPDTAKAKLAIRDEMDWDDCILDGPTIVEDDDGFMYDMWCAYPTEKAARYGYGTGSVTIIPVIRDCRLCGGEGWGDGSAMLRRDGRKGDTACIACGGNGKVLA